MLGFTNCERRASSITLIMEGLGRVVVLATAIKQVKKLFIGERAENDRLLLRVIDDDRVYLVWLAKGVVGLNVVNVSNSRVIL